MFKDQKLVPFFSKQEGKWHRLSNDGDEYALHLFMNMSNVLSNGISISDDQYQIWTYNHYTSFTGSSWVVTGNNYSRQATTWLINIWAGMSAVWFAITEIFNKQCFGYPISSCLKGKYAYIKVFDFLKPWQAGSAHLQTASQSFQCFRNSTMAATFLIPLNEWIKFTLQSYDGCSVLWKTEKVSKWLL